MRKQWTKEEELFLEERWGSQSIKTIATHLDRSFDSVKQKAQRMGIGGATLHYEHGITLSQLSKILDLHYGILKRWIKEHGLPVKRKVFASKQKVLVVRYDEFWKWAEEHKILLNFTRLEPLILGPEPDWVKEKREADQKNFEKKRKRPWSKEDDLLLKGLIHSYQYTYPEISKRLGRSEASIKRRLYDLKIKARPIRLNNHIKYTDKETELLVSMYLDGYGLNTIAEKISKSALGIRGKLERMGYYFKNGIPIKMRKDG